MRYGANSARALNTFRHLCAFYAQLHSDYFLGQFISILKNAFNYYAHFYMKLTLFLQVAVDGCNFWDIFFMENYSHSQKCDWALKVCTRTQNF